MQKIASSYETFLGICAQRLLETDTISEWNEFETTLSPILKLVTFLPFAITFPADE